MFKLFWKDKLIAIQKGQENPFTSTMVALPDIPQSYLPFGLFGQNKREVSTIKFMEWASERCFPENRIGAEKLLNELGLDRYDGWEIVKITKAVMGNDYYSFEIGE